MFVVYARKGIGGRKLSASGGFCVMYNIKNNQGGFAMIPAIIIVGIFVAIMVFGDNYSDNQKADISKTLKQSQETPQISTEKTTPTPRPLPTLISEPTISLVPESSLFLLKSQCAQMGRTFQDKEDYDNKTSNPIYLVYLNREFGYSKNINSCYFSQEVMMLGPNNKEMSINGRVYDLLTNESLLFYVSFSGEDEKTRQQKQSEFYKQRFILLGQ